jgi:CubicO group peptidase (beta-lactamase class C family)
MYSKQFGGKVTKKLSEQYQQSVNWKNGKFQNLEETSLHISLSKMPGIIYRQLTVINCSLNLEKNKSTMEKPVPIFIHCIIGLAFTLFPGYFSFSQSITNPDSLSKNSFGWNQEEKELGFAHFDEVYKAREVPKGRKVYALKQGNPLTALSKGGEKESALEKFITEQKVAGLLVLHNGKIRLERYALGFTENERWTSHSIAKSVTSTLLGAAIKDGYIKSVDEYVTHYIPALKGSAYDSVTIRQLLTMTTGVRWTEIYTDPNADIVKFYNQPVEPGMDATVSYMRGLPREAEPGKKWVYKTGETHLLGVLVSAATGQTLSQYLSSKIWVPYGMEQKATWILGSTNHELAGCCLQMKLRDFGRFGQFMLDGARINGKSIVPDDWLQAATQTQIKLMPGLGYGYQWWTVGDGCFRALGIHGQMIHIDPKRQLVVVINSAWPEAESFMRQMIADNFLKMVVGEIDKEGKATAK